MMQGILNVVSLFLLAIISLLPFVAKHWVKTWFSKDLARLQHLNSISQPTLERVFSKKIEVYTELSKIKNEFYRYTNESHELEHGDLFEDVTERFSGFFKHCREIIEANKLYISSELAERYDAWYSVAHPYYKKSVLDGYEAHQSSFDDNDGRMQVYYSELGAISEMIDETMPQMRAIFDQVDKDISKIRDYAELAISDKLGVIHKE